MDDRAAGDPAPEIGDFQITRFMVMEVIAGVLMLAGPGPGGPAHRADHVSRGWFVNMFEAMILFIRDEVARPAIGGHGADRFLPYLWTVFFFVLFNNLLGIIPGGASATGNINVTAVLAVMTLVTVDRRRDARDGGRRASGWGWCRTSTCPAGSSPRCGA